MFNPALLHSRVVGPWGNLCITQVTPPLWVILSVPVLKLDGCVQAVRDGLQPSATSLGT